MMQITYLFHYLSFSEDFWLEGTSLVDAEGTPAENVRCPASITDRRDTCLLLTQDAGFL